MIGSQVYFEINKHFLSFPTFFFSFIYADALENRNSSIIGKSDDYWNEIISFRKYNQEDCIHDNFGEQQ
jgi:hypothetical protein